MASLLQPPRLRRPRAALGIAVCGPIAARADVLSASVSATPAGRRWAPGFVGVSFEYRALEIYTGVIRWPSTRAGRPAPRPGSRPVAVIRIGGDAPTAAGWPIRGMIPQGGIYYRITKGWLRTTQALAADLNAS